MFGSIVGSVIKGVSGALEKRGNRKHEITLLNHNLRKSKIEAAIKNQGKNIDLDKAIIESNKFTYKDEAVLAVVLAPVVFVFIPNKELQEAVRIGFATLDTMPAWYVSLVVGAIATTLGMRALFNRQTLPTIMPKIFKEKQQNSVDTAKPKD